MASPPVLHTGVLASVPSRLLHPHTIPVGPGPVGIVVTPDGATAYVAASGGAEITAVSTATDTAGSTVPVGAGPWDLAVSPDGARLYASRPAAGVVGVVSTASHTVTGTVTGLATPKGLAVSPDGTTLYVANTGGGTVAVVDTATHTAITAVDVGGAPDTIAFRPDGAVAYVSVPGSGTVRVVSTASRAVTATITGFTTPTGLAVSPDGTTLYVADSGRSALALVSTATHTVTATAALATSPVSVSCSPDGTLVYVTTPGRDSVTVVNSFSATVTTTITGLVSPQRVTTTVDGLRLFVTNGGAGTVLAVRRPASITPNAGSRGGGTTVTITGQGFTGTTAVRFGSRLAPEFTVVDDSHLVVVTPSGTVSGALVQVTSAGGRAGVGHFYYRRLPLLESLSVTEGPMSGGTVITLTGRRFTGVKGVWFGKTFRSVTVLSDSRMTVVAPPSAVAGHIPLHVTNQGGVSNTLSFTYVATMAITSLGPISGPRTGSRPVNINGTGLGAVTSVTFGGVAAVFKVMSDIKVQAITPPGPPGPAAVVVGTADGRTATSPTPYTYT
ncbi:IPT/TIG domain-containing protein [Streptomyces phyllanthi]|uniref:Beta-propeller fold lactonase family protein n=1 Tax=Streptomyces phyllanthi TaxID=1803180 RepID=A0A5N8W140_9ACTN|nr:IPT/TIG domain-containing protein [Streptomyces phyllanthi]MPY40008.1 beta-propeller fold lactonase family protein [Streptomyces phyllanthi]